MKPWVKWLIDHNMKFVLYTIWFIALPLFWLYYIVDAMDDAKRSLHILKEIKKGDL